MKLKWINVNDQLPPNGDVFITYRSNLGNKFYSDMGLYTNGLFIRNGLVTEVTHWMPLPKPAQQLPEFKLPKFSRIPKTIEPEKKIVMEWINIKDNLPPDEEVVLVLIEGYFHKKCDPLHQKTSLKIFHASFDRKIGWYIPYLDQFKMPVMAWMPLPKLPDFLKSE